VRSDLQIVLSSESCYAMNTSEYAWHLAVSLIMINYGRCKNTTNHSVSMKNYSPEINAHSGK